MSDIYIVCARTFNDDVVRIRDWCEDRGDHVVFFDLEDSVIHQRELLGLIPGASSLVVIDPQGADFFILGWAHAVAVRTFAVGGQEDDIKEARKYTVSGKPRLVHLDNCENLIVCLDGLGDA